MFYRVVMQGRTVGGADLAAVKREFVRVTGLPVSVADDMFGGMPKVIKRKVQQADAERIAATLRAIGAAATVERENGAVDAGDGDDNGIEIIAAPLGNGPPTVIPGTAPPEAPPPAKSRTWIRSLREKGPVVAGTLALVAAVVYFADDVSGWVSSFRPAPVAQAPKPAARPAAEADEVPHAAAFNPSLLHGPWRCVDQRTGLGVYWSYAADGQLIFHGDVLSDRPASAGDSATGWKLEGAKLVHKHPQGDVDAFKVAALTLSRLSYAGEKGLEVECRRP
jgi:hypothetical protein